jgi:hypothetical protein
VKIGPSGSKTVTWGWGETDTYIYSGHDHLLTLLFFFRKGKVY